MRTLCGLVLAAALGLTGCAGIDAASPATACHRSELLATHGDRGECVPSRAIRVPGGGGSGARPDGYTPAPPPRQLPPPTAGAQDVSEHGLHFIEGFEGFSSCPYWDPYGGVWTRGYGETEGIGRGSGCISQSYGQANLHYRLRRYYEWAIRGIGVPFSQNQFDALASFAWNLGAGIFTGSLRESLRHYNPYPLLAYDHAGGTVLPGLYRRRHEEVGLFLTGSPPSPPSCAKSCKLARLHVHEARLGHARTRIRVLRREILSHHCRKHEHRGKCFPWYAEGDAQHAAGLREHVIVYRLRRELGLPTNHF